MGRPIISYLILAVIITLGGVLRFYGLNYSPPSLNWDEAALGYNALSLYKTGKDEFGTILPLSLRSFDDYKPPIYSYLLVPLVSLFGLSDIIVRSVSAFFGLLSILLIFIISKQLFGSKSISLFCSFVFAIAPWAVHFSRIAYESNLANCIFLLAFSLVLRNKFKLAIIFALLNSFVYHSAKIYFWLFLVWILIKSFRYSKTKLQVFLLAGLVCFIYFFGVLFGNSLARLKSTQTQDYSLSTLTSKYLGYFSPANLFVYGTNESNQKTPNFSLFYTWEFFSLSLGILFVIQSKLNFKRDILLWLLILPVSALITKSWFTLIRVLPFFSFLSLFSGIGLWKLSRKKILLIVLLPWLFINLSWFWISEYLLLPYRNYGDWQWGFKQIAQNIVPDMQSYDRVIFETTQAQPHIFTLFYLNYPPQLYHSDTKDITSPRNNFDFGKFTFRKIYWPEDRGLSNTIFIGSVYSLPEADLKRDGLDYIDIPDPKGYTSYRIVRSANFLATQKSSNAATTNGK